MDTEANPPLTPASLFERAWNALSGVLGRQTTAVVMRRATRSAAGERAAAEGAADEREAAEGSAGRPAVIREDLEYTYALPPSWQRDDASGREELRRLFAIHVLPLLEELLGPLGPRLLLDALPEGERRRVSLQSEPGPGNSAEAAATGEEES